MSPLCSILFESLPPSTLVLKLPSKVVDSLNMVAIIAIIIMAINKVMEQVRLSARGQWMATILAIFCIVASVAVTLCGHDWVGGLLGGSTVVSLATVFVVGQAVKKEKPKSPRKPQTGK